MLPYDPVFVKHVSNENSTGSQTKREEFNEKKYECCAIIRKTGMQHRKEIKRKNNFHLTESVQEGNLHGNEYFNIFA